MPRDAADGTRVWNVVDLLKWTTQYLATRQFHNARLNAELLLAGVLGLKRLDLYLQFDRPLRPAELAEFKQRLLRRARREPLQYIEGTAHFRHLVLWVDGRVLIPRPETERLVAEVLAWAGGRRELRAVDVGTGSGAIALALASEGADLFAQVIATDVDPDAMEVARANHATVAPPVAVEFRLGDALDPVWGEQLDVLVSNPPYVALRERASLDAEVRDWEPECALFAGQDGLAVIRRLVQGASAVLRRGGLLALEIGAGQAAEVTGLIGAAGGFRAPRVHADFAGRDRIVLAEREG